VTLSRVSVAYLVVMCDRGHVDCSLEQETRHQAAPQHRRLGHGEIPPLSSPVHWLRFACFSVDVLFKNLYRWRELTLSLVLVKINFG
jgi:hypothetical protein